MCGGRDHVSVCPALGAPDSVVWSADSIAMTSNKSLSKEKVMIELKVEGMTCMHCVKAVTEALAAVPGVTGAPEVNLEQGAAKVEGSADPDALVAAVKTAGYAAQVRG
jgi:copper chaperone